MGVLQFFKASLILGAIGVHSQYTATWDPNNLPATSEDGQYGTNECGTGSNQTGLCQNIWVNSVQDFCLWGPPETDKISNTEGIVVSYCTQPGRGTRVMPEGTLISAHFVETPDYIQVTGTGKLTQINISAGDDGGELDPHGADGTGNPHGGLVFTNVWNAGTNNLGEQIHEWNNFMSDTEYCIRLCKAGTKATAYCNNVYDTYGCRWNMPGNYDDGFDSCMGDSDIPMGQYPQSDGSTSTYQTHTDPTPAAQNPAASSQCQTFQSSVIYASAPPTASTATSTGSSRISGTSTPSNSHPASSTTTTHSASGAVTIRVELFYLFLTTLLGLALGATAIY